jgi:Uma2 family endonuclease
MAALPDPSLVSVEEYLATSYPDGDREYLDGLVVERNLGTDPHSALQMILTVHLSGEAKRLRLAVRPECRTRVTSTRYRVPDVLVMIRPYRQERGVVIDPPFLVIEVLSPDDRQRETLKRFADYAAFGVRHIVQMDPEDRTTFVYAESSLQRCELEGFEVPERGVLPFNSKELLARLDDELA